MPHRPRNNIAALPLELRLVVQRGLLDGRTYEQIRADLAAAGAGAVRLHNSSFLAYGRSREYGEYRDAMLAWKRKAEEKSAFWQAVLSGGGAQGLANVATFEAIEALRESLGSAESAGEKARIAAVIGNLTRTIQSEAEARWRREAEEKAAALKAGLAAKSADPAAVSAEIDRILGVTK